MNMCVKKPIALGSVPVRPHVRYGDGAAGAMLSAWASAPARIASSSACSRATSCAPGGSTFVFSMPMYCVRWLGATSYETSITTSGGASR